MYAKTIIEQEKAIRDVERLQRKLADEEQKGNTIEARLNSTNPLDDLEEQKVTLERQIEENKRVTENENTSPSEREAAEARNEEGEEELARLNQQIQAREKARPWRERIKEVFKKYGFTVTAVVTAVGLTIGVIFDKLTTGVSSVTKVVGNGLKYLGKKIGSILPGLGARLLALCFTQPVRLSHFLAKMLGFLSFSWRHS